MLELLGMSLAWLPVAAIELNEDHTMFLIMGAVGVIAILAGTLSSIVKTRSRERTRREVAAYIAEGSMTPEQGERLLQAGGKDD